MCGDMISDHYIMFDIRKKMKEDKRVNNIVIFYIFFVGFNVYFCR